MRHPEAAGVPFASVQDVPVDQRIAQTMSEVGPSITLSAVAETVAFALGAIVSMPAVNSFAGYSAVAIFVDFMLQITCFVTLLGLDARRAEVYARALWAFEGAVGGGVLRRAGGGPLG